MAGRRSAGILPFREVGGGLEVLLGHMGGPLWARRDAGAWSVIKGEHEPAEDPMHAARREFVEELGVPLPPGELTPLGEVRQSGGKLVRLWAVRGEVDLSAVKPGTFELEWPRGSGRVREFPEIDRVEWFPIDVARAKMVAAQSAFVDRLAELCRRG